MLRLLPMALLPITLVALLVAQPSSGRMRGGSPFGIPAISFMSFSAPFRYLDNYPNSPQYYAVGDSWYTEWGDDNKYYITCNDCDTQQVTSSQNMILNTMSGWALATAANGGPSVIVVPPNYLATPWGAYNSDTPTDGTGKSYKNAGLLCLPLGASGAGWFYLNTRRYSNVDYTFQDGQIIKSHDHGASWSPAPTSLNQPYTGTGQPMFPGIYTLSGYFHYGQCYNGASASIDNSSNYVYAGFYETFGNNVNPSPTYLARVPITAIDNLNAPDWQYYTGVSANNDGLAAGSWTSTFNASTATKIIDPSVAHAGWVTPTKECCGNDFVYLPRYQRYLHFGAGGAGPGGGVMTTAWTAPHPWGPFQIVGQFESQHVESWPQPIIASLLNGGQTVTLAMSGDNSTNCCDPSNPNNWATLVMRTVTISP